MKIKSKVILLITFFFITMLPAFAEADSLYIKRYKNQLIISAFSGVRLAGLAYENEEQKLSQTYLPSTSAELGVGVAWNWFAASTKIYSFKPDNEHGKTTSFDFQSHWFLPKVQVSLSLQNYKGFYTEDEQNNDAIILRPDLNIKLYRLSAQYILNNKRFSYRSVFEYDERQCRSAGSLIFGLGLYYTTIKADSTLILNDIDKNKVDTEDFQIGPNVGYTYNYIFGKQKQWFLNGSMTIGLGVSIKNNDNQVKFFPTYYPRLAFGFNGKRWTMGLSVHFLSTQVSKMEDAIVSLNSGLFRLTYSYRFPFDLKKLF